MTMHDFPDEQTCPTCRGTFTSAPLKDEFVQGALRPGEAPVVSCPHCGVLLWRPGLDPLSGLFPFDPDADQGGI